MQCLVLVLLLAALGAGAPRFAKITSLPGMPRVGFEQWAGQISVNDSCPAAVFAWVAKARNPGVQTPVVMFLNGGPGSSTFLA